MFAMCSRWNTSEVKRWNPLLQLKISNISVANRNVHHPGSQPGYSAIAQGTYRLAFEDKESKE